MSFLSHRPNIRLYSISLDICVSNFFKFSIMTFVFIEIDIYIDLWYQIVYRKI